MTYIIYEVNHSDSLATGYKNENITNIKNKHLTQGKKFQFFVFCGHNSAKYV